MQAIYRFDSIDQDEMRRWTSLSPGQRVLVMLRSPTGAGIDAWLFAQTIS